MPSGAPANTNGHRRREIRKRVLTEETHCALCDEYVDKTLTFAAGRHGPRCKGNCLGCVPNPRRAEVVEDMPRSRGGSNIGPKIKARETNARVGRVVQYVMRERDVNQVQLAKALGLTDSQMSRRITGKVDWTPDDLETAARVLHVEVGLFFALKLPGLDSNQEPIGFTPTNVIEADFGRPLRAVTPHPVAALPAR